MTINDTMAALGSPYKLNPERREFLEAWLDAAGVAPYEYLAHIKMIPADKASDLVAVRSLAPAYICAQKVRDGFLYHRKARMEDNAIRMDLQRRRLTNLLKDGRSLSDVANDHGETFCHLLRWLLLRSDGADAAKVAKAALFELRSQPELVKHLLSWGFDEWAGYLKELEVL